MTHRPLAKRAFFALKPTVDCLHRLVKLDKPFILFNWLGHYAHGNDSEIRFIDLWHTHWLSEWWDNSIWDEPRWKRMWK